jgi:hypothetical protein
VNNNSSRFDKSNGILFENKNENPNIKFNHDRKKKVGPIKYKKFNKNKAIKGNKSKKKLKNRNSAMKKIEPGKPKNISVFTSIIKNSFGHKKFNPLISVISLVLNLRATASTNKKEFVDNKA